MSSSSGVAEESLVEAALRVLNTADPFEKLGLAMKLQTNGCKDTSLARMMLLWISQYRIALAGSPIEMPKLGKAGSLQSRQALVHSLVHTESWAIDLSWDIIARFGTRVPCQEISSQISLISAPSTATSKDLLARFEHCVHEARGLDVLPTTISRFRKGGDDKTADLLGESCLPQNKLLIVCTKLVSKSEN
ncbi:hypothetical protein Sango_2684700 [Sesamum angolense]|uniref:Uncharacterized protein n=1 Tax=Sesamum angolense TaxID=2727404 RepID=A0AAE2BHH5_9LAMI|nr:hypothetical protein Sango_2684700 [Sesamum angolense]